MADEYNTSHHWLVGKWENLDGRVNAMWERKATREWIQRCATIICVFGILVSSYYSMKGVGTLTKNMKDNVNFTIYYAISPAILTNSITFSSLLLTLLTIPFMPTIEIRKINIEKKFQDEIKRHLAGFVFCFELCNFGVLHTACGAYSIYNWSFFFIGVLFGSCGDSSPAHHQE